MNDEALFQATHPVFQHYLERINTLVCNLPCGQVLLLNRSLIAGAFNAAEHLQCALCFIPRTIDLLRGQDVADLWEDCPTQESLMALHGTISSRLACVDKTDFDGAAQRVIHYKAGGAFLRHSATEFVSLFALPNFFFHFTSGHAILRRSGLDIGKADFDGIHQYESGFTF